MSLSIVQTIDNSAEKMAHEIAKVWDTAGKEEAAALFNTKSREHNLVTWEASALAHMVTCMIHDKPWKKEV